MVPSKPCCLYVKICNLPHSPLQFWKQDFELCPGKSRPCLLCLHTPYQHHQRTLGYWQDSGCTYFQGSCSFLGKFLPLLHLYHHRNQMMLCGACCDHHLMVSIEHFLLQYGSIAVNKKRENITICLGPFEKYATSYTPVSFERVNIHSQSYCFLHDKLW